LKDEPTHAMTKKVEQTTIIDELVVQLMQEMEANQGK
jgi:hypothetical protein